ncbi:MAG TPA: DUF6063 family protein [Thermotogota bacterium]|nr:DUF6063 family protein [Thermotogota bacterium]
MGLNYEENERFRQFSRILIKLLSNGEISEQEDRDLIIAYETDEILHDMLAVFAEEANMEIYNAEYGYLCLFQRDARSPFSMKRAQFYAETGFDEKSWPIFSFYVFAIFSLFFDDEENQSISLDMIQRFCTEKVEKIKNELKEQDINQKYDWNFSGLLEIWENLRETANLETSLDRSSSRTKQGYLKKTCQFLCREGLVEFAEEFQTISMNKKTEGVLESLLRDEKFKAIAQYLRGEDHANA